MSITYHAAISSDGGAKGDEISSGVVNEILPEISLANQSAGATISRKFYIANSGATDVAISALSLDAYTVFATILFESSADAQIVTGLTGSETDESPIAITIPASSHKSFWLVVTVPSSSTETSAYNRSDVKSIY